MIFNSVSEIYGFLDISRDKLIELVANLDENQANFRPDEQSWSVAQIVEHLGKTERGLTLVFRKLADQPDAEAFDGTLNPPVSFVEIAEEAKTKKLEAPPTVVPQSGQTIGESLEKLKESRKTIYDFQSRLEASDLSKNLYPHPAFGNMNIYQWLVLIGFHEMRHTAQIEKILARVQN